MTTLNSSLLIGIQALEASQGALNATSNNIANANTPGYTREVVQLSAIPQSYSGSQVAGGGVSIDGVKSVRDELLSLQIQQQTSQQSSADTQSAALQAIQSYFTSGSGDDIASALSSFTSTITQLSANPTSGSARQGVLSAGQNLAAALRNTSAGLTQAQSNANSQVTQTVAEINSLTQQIAQLNPQVNSLIQSGKDGGTVEDQLDQLVQQLSGLTNISITQTSDGETIMTGNGTPLVVAGQSFKLQTTTAPDGTQQVLDTNGNNITSNLTSGQLGGAIQVRDNILAGYKNQLNTLASQIATAFNTAQAEGFDSAGNAGQDFFSIPAASTNPASDISVALADPSLIAASSDGSAGSNGNVANLSAALTSDLSSGQTPSAAYASLLFQVGDDASTASSQSKAIGLSLQQLTDQQNSVSGVSTDEETANLLRFQTAYEAAARIVSTIQQLSTVTLNMGSSGGY